jgi:hypothetical protein
MMEQAFETAFCKGTIRRRDNHHTKNQVSLEDVEVSFRVMESVDEGGWVYYLAAAPADRRGSFSGSGLPFADAKQALDRTPNRGVAKPDPATGVYTVRLRMPNAYYAGLGTVRIEPTLYLYYTTHQGATRRTASIVVSPGIPYRTLTYPASRRGAAFYTLANDGLPLRSQEEIIRASAYPKQDVNACTFWGGKPPM